MRLRDQWIGTQAMRWWVMVEVTDEDEAVDESTAEGDEGGADDGR